MSDLSSKTALVFDHGVFLEFALRLSRGFGRVLYHNPWEYGYSHSNDAMVGFGMEEIEWCPNPLDPSVVDEVDVFCFPDIQHSDAQLLLEKMGKPVWGSRNADSFELLREKFKRTLGEIGLPVADYVRVTGLSELRDYLKDNEDVYVKISRFRGSMETFHHVNMPLSQPWLDQMACEFGGVKDHIPFIVEKAIPDAIELGLDTICIDGQMPESAIHGLEVKDKGYIGVVQPYSKMPAPVREVAEAFTPLLKELRYRNFLGLEMRITEDSTPYFTDPCCRHSSPAGETKLEIYDNLPEVVWAGAHGELVEPVANSKYAVQCWIEHTQDAKHWRALEIPDDIRRFVKLRYACFSNGVYQLVPQPDPDPHIGWIVGLGDTIEGAIDHAKDVAEKLSGQYLITHTEFLVDALKTVQDEEEKGIEFTSDEIPEPSEVV